MPTSIYELGCDSVLRNVYLKGIYKKSEDRNRKPLSLAISFLLIFGAFIVMLGTVIGPPGQEHKIWGTANEGVIHPGVGVPDGREITAWIDGVTYGNTLTVATTFDLYIDGDTWGVTADNNNKDGGYEGDAIVYFLDYNPMDYYLNVSHTTSSFNTSFNQYVDSMFFNRTDQAPDLTTLRMLKINEIVLDPGDGLPQYVFIYDPGQNLGMNNITDYYLQKDNNITHTTDGETFDFLTHADDITDNGEGYYCINLTSDLELNDSDELKLVWKNPFTPNIDPALTGPGNGTDIIVDRVEWGNYTNYINPVTPPDDRDYDNTTLLDFINTSGLYGTGASMIRTDDKLSPGYSGNGTDTDNCFADFKILGQCTSRPQQLFYPIHNIDTDEYFDTIQAAIDDPDTQDSHTIEVTAGTYYENVVVNKTINLIGEGKNTTIIDGGELGDTVLITEDWVNITEFTIIKSGNLGVPSWLGSSNIDAGIELRNVTNIKVYRNDLLDNHYGIYLNNSDGNYIMNNNVSGNDNTGILLYEGSSNNMINNNIALINKYGIEITLTCNNNILTDNNVSQNGFYGIIINYWSENNILDNNTLISNIHNGIVLDHGSDSNTFISNTISKTLEGAILITSSKNNTLINNVLVENGIRFNGNGDMWWSTHNIDTSNTVNGKPVYYWKNQVGGTVPSSAGQVILVNCENVTVENQNFSNSTVGIQLGYSTKNTITNNTASIDSWGFFIHKSTNNIIKNNNISSIKFYGITLHESSNNTLTNNNAMENGNGIYIYDSSSNTIHHNIIANNKRGIEVYASDNNTIFNNSLPNNDYGIYIRTFSKYNTITGNNISSNNILGINLFGSSYNNITGNNIWNNNLGISLEVFSHNNTYHHNNIINNMNQVYLDIASCFNNVWDDGGGEGNYWSDYYGLDDGSGGRIANDGVGDTQIPHPFTDQGNGYYQLDNFPLMYPVGNYIYLYEGWNLISIPFIQTDTNLGQVLSSIQGAYDAVQWLDPTDQADPWKHNCTTKPSHLNDLESIDQTVGFWIHIIEPGGILFRYLGTEPTINQSIPLHPGWNMVGYPSLSNRNRTAALNNIIYGTDVDAIWTFNAATQTWQEIGPSDYFELGRGYWIHSKVTKVWDVPL